VIAADEELSHPARAFNDLVWTGPIANNIAQIKNHIVGGSGREAGIKSFEIAMNVA
jgi:hypothetical protein